MRQDTEAAASLRSCYFADKGRLRVVAEPDVRCRASLPGRVSKAPDSPRSKPPACADPLAPTIFHEPWWVETTREGRYDEVALRAAGSVAARLPFFLARRPGIT